MQYSRPDGANMNKFETVALDGKNHLRCLNAIADILARGKTGPKNFVLSRTLVLVKIIHL
jgi:hypothetical protein